MINDPDAFRLKKLDKYLIQKKGILRKGSVIRQMQKRNFSKEKEGGRELVVTVGNADPELSNQGERELGRSFVYKQGNRDPNYFGMSDDNISKPSRLDDSRGSRGNGRDKEFSSPLGSKKERTASMIAFEQDKQRAKTISNM